MILILSIMISMGILGGIINYLFSGEDEWSWISVARASLIGIGASLLVPLFLRMISSNLLNDVADKSDGYFVLMGFCLVASISSRAFIGSITSKVMRELSDKTDKMQKKIEQVQNEVTPVIEKSTDTSELELDQSIDERDFELNKKELCILEAFDSSPYAIRTVRGLLQQTRPEISDREFARRLIGELKKKGFVGELAEVPSLSPKPRYFLTNIGRIALRKSQSNTGESVA
ncbi:YEATS-associated helix-containing protein [Photobacterium leiognathi]|uniref:YEATS-associated helix-containing protein n=1 Tax=Photobacterium leiognathi TaxID=553611 RepID=UPI0029821F75|nr:YEATS-associated helix-containing protein [Photobacterium leiognathi]